MRLLGLQLIHGDFLAHMVVGGIPCAPPAGK
jgi:hypothetical protein